jgi:hypothetical protein
MALIWKCNWDVETVSLKWVLLDAGTEHCWLFGLNVMVTGGHQVRMIASANVACGYFDGY